MWNHLKTSVLATACILVGTIAATAAPLISTGVGGVGSAETNWIVTSGAPPTALDPVLPAFAVDGAEDYPGAWASTTGLEANWITPYSNGSSAINDASSNAATNVYTYTLASFTAPVTDIIIQWATDNGAEFFLNGTLLSSIPAPTISDTPYTPLQSFVILASAFATSNTFEVVVTNLAYSGANPTGLVVDVSAVPLPPAALLFGSALLGLNWLRRRRSQKIGAIART